MERYVIVIPADEEQKARLVRCDDGDTCKLETLQTLVGGPIETAESCLAANWAREDVDSIQLIVNEEGLLQELPFNERATDLYQYRYMSGIVGTAVLMAAMVTAIGALLVSSGIEHSANGWEMLGWAAAALVLLAAALAMLGLGSCADKESRKGNKAHKAPADTVKPKSRRKAG